MFGKGISKEGDILDLAVNCDIINKSGAWFAYKGEKIGQGRENAQIYLQSNPEVCKEIEHLVRVMYGIDKDDTAEEEVVDAKAKATKSAKSE